MSNSTILSLTFASQQVTIYVGFFLFIAGIIGDPLTLIVFLSLRTFRQSSCAFYLTIMSFVNTLHLFTGLLTYIMIYGFAINWLNMSLFYCKFRSFNVQLLQLTSLSCMCLATIDQFFATCSDPRWRTWNNIKVARYMLIGIVITWILHGIPFLIYYNQIISPITGKISCIVTNVIFQKYYNIFHLIVLINCLPIIIMIVFGILSYRNVQQLSYRTVPLVRRELDKQLTVMVLVQVFYDVIAIIPSAIFNIFNCFFPTPTDPVIAAKLSLISILVIIIYYFHFVVNINYIYKNDDFFFYFLRVHFTYIYVHQSDFVNNSSMFFLQFISIDFAVTIIK